MNVDFENRIASVADAYVNEHYPESKLEDGLYGASDLYDGLSESFIEGYKHGYKDAIQSVYDWITNTVDIPYEGKIIDGSPDAQDYLNYIEKRLECATEVVNSFKNYMEKVHLNN